MEKIVLIDEILSFLGNNFELLGKKDGIIINNAKPILEADKNSVCWINPKKNDKYELIKNTKACLVICDNSIMIDNAILKDKAIIKVDNPKLVFLRIVERR